MLVAAGFEAVGLLLIVPLLQLLTAAPSAPLPASAHWLVSLLGHPRPLQVAAVLATIAFFTFLTKGVFSLLLLRWTLGTIFQEESLLSRRLLSAYLHAPYRFHLTRSSAELQRTVHDDVRRVYEDAVVALVGGSADAVVILAIGVVLLIVTPIIALCAIAYFALVGVGYQRLIHGRAQRAGEVIHHEAVAAYRMVQQGVGAIKAVKLHQKEDFFTDQLFAAKTRAARRLRTILILYQSPRYYLETAMILGIAVMAVVSYAILPPDKALTTLGLFLAAGLRLLPSLNRVLVATTAVRAGLPPLEAITRDLELLPVAPRDEEAARPLPPSRIEVDNLCFAYHAGAPLVLDGVSFVISPGDSVAFVGASGAGKTTLLDLLLGLLDPSAGLISIGGCPLSEVRRSWQRSVGYVPQDVVLLDDSLRSNIAFGDAPEMADEARVATAAAHAQLAELISELPDGLDTEVEERGVRLSGGQRQRVGIARALYGSPSVLVLDEATSALDADTEHRIVDTIERLRGTLTIIMVTHRLSTVKACDRIYYLENGKIAAVGTFTELLQSNAAFRQLVKLSALPDGPKQVVQEELTPVTLPS